MSTHKFAAGDKVTPIATGWNMNVRPGVYTIVKILPLAGLGCQYRVKSPLDAHERVLDEAQLLPAKG